MASTSAQVARASLPLARPATTNTVRHGDRLRLLLSCAAVAYATLAAPLAGQDQDWGSLARYRAANEQLGPPAQGEARVVFFGNSITEGWAPYFPEMFPAKPYVGRGVSGQTTPRSAA